MQKLGQHFLKNGAVAKKIVNALSLDAHDAVIEIGPGHGELTVPLAHACVAAGASLAVIEKDPRLADGLRKRLADEKIGMEVAVTCDDALKVLPDMIGTTSTSASKLAGNLPYYITGKLLRIISDLEPERRPERCVFMVQREVAERIVAAAPEMNRLAASVQFWAAAEIVVHVPKGDFSPPPKIDSAVIALVTKKDPLPVPPALYYEAVRTIFAQPRKMLINNLAAAEKKSLSKEQIVHAMGKMGLAPTSRPQDLSIENIVRLAELLF
ncbi:MAG: 16S rRNA (adenine(1518)-N(6)/adenine(1519)-N(6))-dimethyltransferase RsmA [Candidatus Pacebacteria bacterium]|nr:16S rRNA (adenine(1518)-N(6)/adenine(1519)-N(6))-dimethyltransferase RsmA [Candidatus Paceibacterota bacterium]